MRYASSKSPLLGLIILAVIVLMIFSVVITPYGQLYLAAAGSLVIAFLLWLWFGTYYELREEFLYCRSGIFTEKIPYDRITSLRLCRNHLSSMAVGDDRIEITHGKSKIAGLTYISPTDRQEFYEKLTALCPNIQK